MCQNCKRIGTTLISYPPPSTVKIEVISISDPENDYVKYWENIKRLNKNDNRKQN
jgi:hypothetical protein